MAEEIGPHTIAIIGAGVAGPVFALTILSNPILRQRYKPVIFERLPCPTSVSPIETSHSENQNRDNSGEAHREATYAAGAAVALTSNALYPLYNLGLRSSLDKFSYETTRIKIWRAWGGNGEGEHQYFNQINNPNWQEDLGTCLRVVERAQLQRLVLDRVQDLGGTVIWGRKLKDIQTMEQEGVKLLFEGGEEFIAGLVVGADGGWSAVRQHIIMSSNKKGNDDVAGKVEDRWKPDFAGADGIYGVSSPLESSGNDRDGTEEGDKDDLREGDTHWVLLDSGTASTWSLPGGRQFWTISFPSDVPPNRRIKDTGEQLPALGKLYGADVTLGGYEFKETEEILKKYENAWHPIAGSFGELFRKSERIVRAPLWYRAWETNEIGGKNAVVIGDAARLMLPTSGQGAGFSIEDATILADQLLEYPPTSDDGTMDFTEAIQKYAEARVPRSKSMTNQSYWTAVVGLGRRWWWRWLRDWATKWLPMGGDPKATSGKKAKDPMGWLYEVRYKVGQREDGPGLND